MLLLRVGLAAADDECTSTTADRRGLEACPALGEKFNFTLNRQQCQGTKACTYCVPECKPHYFWHGEPARCNENATAWEPLDVDSGCKFEGVHRVGIGVFVLNVGEVSLTDNTFHIDFMLSVFTEHYKFDTYEGAIATFDNNVSRICDAAVMNHSNPRPSDLGGKLGSRNAVNNTFSPLSPSQYLRRAGYRLSTTEIANTASDLFDPNILGLSFLTMDSPKIEKLTLGTSTPSWRIQGKGFFKPQFADWPFDTQTLKVYVEDLNLPLRPDLSFLTCHMPSFSGLSSTIRLPPSFTPSFVAASEEVCWPPFNQAARGTDDLIVVGGGESQAGGSCDGQHGVLISSRFAAVLQLVAPDRQRFLTIYLPVALIAFINAMSYMLPDKDYNLRVTICIGTLTMLCVLHLSLSGYHPGNGSESLGDLLLIICYILNAISWLVAVLVMALVSGDMLVTASAVSLFFRWCAPFGTFALLMKFFTFRTRDAFYDHFGELLGFYFLGWVVGSVCQLIELKLVGLSLGKHPIVKAFQLIRRQSPSSRSANLFLMKPFAGSVQARRSPADVYDDEDNEDDVLLP